MPCTEDVMNKGNGPKKETEEENRKKIYDERSGKVKNRDRTEIRNK